MKIVRMKDGVDARTAGMRCDRCNAEARLHGDISGLWDFQEFLCVDFTAGYGAKAFADGIHYSCELCENCVKDLLGSYLRSDFSGWRYLFHPTHRGKNPRHD